jgi:ClpP class serine protease
MLENLDITSGRTFIGAQTQQVGLVDGILSFDQAFAKISDLAKKNIESRQLTRTYTSSSK